MVMTYREEYEQNADDAAAALMSALEGAIRHGADPAMSQQLRAQLSRWIKKRRASVKRGCAGYNNNVEEDRL